jgi:predicted ester cyclase
MDNNGSKKSAEMATATPPVTPTLAITDAYQNDIGKMMSPGTQKRQPMRGFDEDYVDIVDYIVRCTHKIWEEKGIGLVYTHYSHNALVHLSDGSSYGREKMVEDTIRRASMFPDGRAFADDVIWSGNDVDGFYTSHRIQWVGTHLGYGVYGAPTGRKAARMAVAHCFVKENRIIEEWLSREELAVIRQLGLNEFEVAKEMAIAEAESGRKSPVPLAAGDIERVRGQMEPPLYPSREGAFDPEDFIRRVVHEVWNWRLLNKVNEYYTPTITCRAATNRQLYGHGDYKAYVLALLAAIPDLFMSVDHVSVLDDGNGHYRIAVRWVLIGTHTGHGWYGKPTGKRVQLIGFTHSHVKDGKIYREWFVLDEFALLKQIYSPL